MYEQTKRENEKLKGLKGQMQGMSQDFDDMIKAREEAKNPRLLFVIHLFEL